MMHKVDEEPKKLLIRDEDIQKSEILSAKQDACCNMGNKLILKMPKDAQFNCGGGNAIDYNSLIIKVNNINLNPKTCKKFPFEHIKKAFEFYHRPLESNTIFDSANAVNDTHLTNLSKAINLAAEFNMQEYEKYLKRILSSQDYLTQMRFNMIYKEQTNSLLESEHIINDKKKRDKKKK